MTSFASRREFFPVARPAAHHCYAAELDRLPRRGAIGAALAASRSPNDLGRTRITGSSVEGSEPNPRAFHTYRKVRIL